MFSTLPIDLTSLPGPTSIAHIDLPPGNYLVIGKAVVDSLLGSIVNCSLDFDGDTLDVAGLGSLLAGLRPTTMIGVVTVPGTVDMICPQALATLTNLRLTAIKLESLTNVPLP